MSAHSESKYRVLLFKKLAFRFADIAFQIVTGLIKTHVTMKEPCMECAVIFQIQ